MTYFAEFIGHVLPAERHFPRAVCYCSGNCRAQQVYFITVTEYDVNSRIGSSTVIYLHIINMQRMQCNLTCTKIICIAANMPRPSVVLKSCECDIFFPKKYNVLNMLYILLCRGFFRLPSILLHQCRYLKVFSFARAV